MKVGNWETYKLFLYLEQRTMDNEELSDLQNNKMLIVLENNLQSN